MAAGFAILQRDVLATRPAIPDDAQVARVARSWTEVMREPPLMLVAVINLSAPHATSAWKRFHLLLTLPQAIN